MITETLVKKHIFSLNSEQSDLLNIQSNFIKDPTIDKSFATDEKTVEQYLLLQESNGSFNDLTYPDTYIDYNDIETLDEHF
ncbi:hypothetical protein [Photobacterium damselae]|uniref:hypothetical protein n=1 Tax=Photobacterium damselae TaxID=38293 RepID=UPI001EFE2C36|nr:hypothetical protein [Photobacterium damselae]MCG9780581.1 hypothetical protein [Photobacterium damselae]